MRILQTNYENLIFHAGQPVSLNGVDYWDVAYDDDWFEICSTPKTGIFKVDSILGTVTQTINEEIAFINYFKNKYT